jgi:hypothetical protein
MLLCSLCSFVAYMMLAVKLRDGAADGFGGSSESNEHETGFMQCELANAKPGVGADDSEQLTPLLSFMTLILYPQSLPEGRTCQPQWQLGISSKSTVTSP